MNNSDLISIDQIKIKILWFTNTPANADEYLKKELKGSGGWLKELDKELQNYVELHIAFYNNCDNIFTYKQTTYHPIKKKRSFYRKVVDRFTNKFTDKEDNEKYCHIIKLVKPDIIHIHGTENPFSNLSSHTNIPVVLSIQGILTIIFHKYCSGFEKKFLHINNRNVSNLKNLLLPWSFYIEYRLFKKWQKREENNLKFIKYIIGRTSWDFRITRILAPNSFYYHSDEILRDSFYVNQWIPHFSEKVIINTTSSNTFYKGFETLCAALNELNKIGFNCEWRVAGIAANDLIVKVTKKKLREIYPKYGLILLGEIKESKLVDSLLRADIYVMSSHIDNSPNSLCEAMILGLPCISTFVGGIGSLLKDNEEGILVQNNDPWSLAGAILEMANNKERAVHFGENARKVALLRHDKVRIVSDLLKIYKSVINAN